MSELELMVIVNMFIILSFILCFLFFGQDKEFIKEELKKEREIANIYFSILSDIEKEKYLAKYPEPFFLRGPNND